MTGSLFYYPPGNDFQGWVLFVLERHRNGDRIVKVKFVRRKGCESMSRLSAISVKNQNKPDFFQVRSVENTDRTCYYAVTRIFQKIPLEKGHQLPEQLPGGRLKPCQTDNLIH